MGVRNVLRTEALDPFSRIGRQIKDITEELFKLRSIVRRDCWKVRGYELEYRTAGTGGPGVYMVNKIDGDPNEGTATFIGP